MSINRLVGKVVRGLGLTDLLAGDCLLCLAPAGDGLLCTGCLADLPRLAALVCPVCALPTPAGQSCGTCLQQRRHFDATVAQYRYDAPLDRLIQAFKYAHRLPVADLLATTMLDGPRPQGDLLVAAPLSTARLRERGFNQAQELARRLARGTGLPLLTGPVLKVRDTPAQASLPWPRRQANIRHAFECRADLAGKTVIVVDDVMTTGATLDELARTLKHAGASRVVNWVVARVLPQTATA